MTKNPKSFAMGNVVVERSTWDWESRKLADVLSAVAQDNKVFATGRPYQSHTELAERAGW